MKSDIIRFRVTKIEHAIIQKKAEDLGITTSEFLRSLALDYKIMPRLSDLDIQHYKMLSKYADNFRRISNLFKNGDTTGVKEHSLETSHLIREFLLKNFKS